MDTIQANVAGKKAGTGGPPLTITIRTAMELSGLSRATINRAIWSGKLKSSCVGSRRLITYSSFEDLLGLNQSDAA